MRTRKRQQGKEEVGKMKKKIVDEITKQRRTLDQIMFEIRWIQRNMNPPVNYVLVIIVSITASVLTTLAILHL